MEATASTLAEVQVMLAGKLGLAGPGAMAASTRLIGSMPELDSLAVAELIAAMEERFGFEVDYADISIDIFETVGTLAAYIEEHRPGSAVRASVELEPQDAVARA